MGAMTISGFFPFFARYIPDLPPTRIPGLTAVAIDGSAVIHRLLTRHAVAIMEGGDIAGWYRDLVAELRRGSTLKPQ